jgi:ketosteroid isomerase-like protein
VLIFRDVLGWTAPEVAELLESTVVSVNSALQRARATIEERLPAAARPTAGPTERELLGRYVDAFERDDMDGLVALLREDAMLRMPPQPSVIGSLEVAQFFRETAAGGDLSRMRLTPTSANGRPAVAVHHRTRNRELIPHGILVLEIEDEQIVGIDAFIDPALGRGSASQRTIRAASRRKRRQSTRQTSTLTRANLTGTNPPQPSAADQRPSAPVGLAARSSEQAAPSPKNRARARFSGASATQPIRTDDMPGADEDQHMTALLARLLLPGTAEVPRDR